MVAPSTTQGKVIRMPDEHGDITQAEWDAMTPHQRFAERVRYIKDLEQPGSGASQGEIKFAKRLADRAKEELPAPEKKSRRWW